MFVSQGLQVLVVAFLAGAFFVAFGALAITPHVVEGIRREDRWIQVQTPLRQTFHDRARYLEARAIV